MNRNYKELVFTNHALNRLKERGVGMSEAWACWRHPQKREYAATRGGWVFTRNWGKRQIEVVAKQNDRKDWVVLTVWSNRLLYNPPAPLWLRILKWLWKRFTRSIVR
jgi:hypothetical protein